MTPAPKSDAGPLEGIEVLVVEDNWHVAKSIKSWLENVGARVVGPASTLALGRVLADVHNPHVAVIDLNLGGTLAYPLITWLGHRGVPVVVVTGYSFASEVTANLDAVLAKPVERDSLIETIQAALRAVPEPRAETGRPRQDLS